MWRKIIILDKRGVSTSLYFWKFTYKYVLSSEHKAQNQKRYQLAIQTLKKKKIIPKQAEAKQEHNDFYHH